MTLFSKFRRHKPEQPLHAVVITVRGRQTDARLHPNSELTELIDTIIEVLEGTGLGDFDILESTRDSAIIHFSGPDAEGLFLGVKSTLESLPICDAAHVLIRQGDHGAPQREVIIHSIPPDPSAGDSHA